MLATYGNDNYFDDDGSGGYANYKAQEQALRLTFARLLKNLKKRGATGGKLLEVGCGLGYLLDEAGPYFQVRHGTDFSSGAVAQAAKVADAVFCGGIEALEGDEIYDCVISNHVIEHVYQPGEFIQQLLARLRPGGSLVISTPHMGSYWRKFMGKRWPSFKLPEHIHYFDQPHLESLLASQGVQQIRDLPYPHAFPLSLVAAKLGLSVPASLGKLSLWIPQTTLALIGKK